MAGCCVGYHHGGREREMFSIEVVGSLRSAAKRELRRRLVVSRSIYSTPVALATDLELLRERERERER